MPDSSRPLTAAKVRAVKAGETEWRGRIRKVLADAGFRECRDARLSCGRVWLKEGFHIFGDGTVVFLDAFADAIPNPAMMLRYASALVAAGFFVDMAEDRVLCRGWLPAAAGKGE